MKIDMHVHTIFSDGCFSPKELFIRAKAEKLSGLAITDHDTLDGLADAKKAAEACGLVFFPGVELSTCSDGASVHILGYGVSAQDKNLRSFLKKYRETKAQRVEKILDKLNRLGFSITMDDLDVSDMNNLGRPHVARAMVKLGHVSNTDQAFAEYLQHGKSAYVPREKADTEEVVQLLQQSGSIPVLAHPGLINMPSLDGLKAKINLWMEAGLQGIEAYHPAHTVEECRAWEAFARSKNLFVTGGSDFHEEPPGSQHGFLGQMFQTWIGYEKDTQRLLQSLKLLDGIYA